MILIKNKQRKIKVDTEQLQLDAERILTFLKYQDYDLGIVLTSNATMQKYNRDYRHKDKATDILSFPFYPKLKPGERIKPTSDDEKNLGDLIIAPQYVQKDAPNWKQNFDERMRVLLVHGICHLLGYDHETEEEYVVMHRKEKALLKKLSQ